MLVLSRKIGEAIRINDDIEIIISEVSGDKVKIGIEAPPNFKILRKELWLTEQNNKKAAQASSKKLMIELLHELKVEKQEEK